MLIALRRFFKKRFFAILFLSSIAGMALYFLMSGFGGKTSKSILAMVAEVQEINGVVKLKSADAFSWERVSKLQSIHDQQIILTGEDGLCHLLTSDGFKVQVEANSYLVVSQKNPKQWKLVQGSMIVHEPGQKSGSRIAQGADADLSVQELLVRLVKPENTEVFFSKPGLEAKLQFQWGELQEKSSVSAIQVSKERDFSGEDLKLFSRLANNKSIEAKLPSGRYYWRALNKESKVISESQQFSVVDAVALQPLYPRGRSLNWSSGISFKWVVPSVDLSLASESTQHALEISGDPEFKNILKRKKIQASVASHYLSGLPEGRYYWRIKSKFNELVVNSPVEKFTLNKAKFLSVEGKWPKEASFLSSNQSPRLEWISNAEEANFRVEIKSEDGAFAKEINTSTRYSSLPNLRAGTYRWRLHAKKGKFSKTSQWRSFSVLQPWSSALNYPRNQEKLSLQTSADQFDFKWEKISSATQYRVELSTTPDFKNLVGAASFKSSRAPSSELINDDSDQYYYWRVIGYNKKQPLAISSVGEFQYGIKFKLRAPELQLPLGNATLNPLEDKKLPRFSWHSSRGANRYEFSLFDANQEVGSQTAPIFRKSTSALSVEVPELAEGTYLWRVRSIDKSGKAGKASASRKVLVSYGAPLQAPVSRSEQVQ